MSFGRSSTTTCLVARLLTRRRYKPILEPFTQGDPIVPPWEEELLSLEKVSTYLGKHFARCGVAIRFDPDTMTLICQPEGSEETIRLPAQGITKAELMGELAALQALPIYQLALPFSLSAWRQLEYAHNLAGTTS